jgi:hypothetical protein
MSRFDELDALIAVTYQVCDLVLATHGLADFDWLGVELCAR